MEAKKGHGTSRLKINYDGWFDQLCQSKWCFDINQIIMGLS